MSRSIYQNNGKPLSQQAIYQQKLKQGVFNTPGIPSVGVNSNASDTAALLAASSDLTVRPSYERTVAKEAHNAALAARKENIDSWTRDGTDQDADAAAAYARSSTLKSSAGVERDSKIGTGVSSMSSSSIYKVANEKSSVSMSHRMNPEKDIKRSGLAAKSAGAALDIDKINRIATQQSTKSLSSRFNPDLDYRSGLKVKSQQPAEYLDGEEEKLAASSAAASLKHGSGFTNQVSSQRRSTMKASDFVNGTLLSAASSKANDRLAHLNSTTPVDFKERAQAYASALTIAQKNSEERIKNNTAGLIHLGGGLTVTKSEMDKLASSVVQPVLDELNTKAESQREYDNLKKKKHEELVALHEEAKQEEIKRLEKEKQEIEAAKQERVAANEKEKSNADEEYLTHQSGRNEEVEAKVSELKEAEAKYAEEKEAILKEKQENEERISREETELIEERKKALEEMQAEKDEIIQPVLTELEEENSKLKEITGTRDQLASEVEEAETANKELEEKLAELTNKLDLTKKDIEKYTTLLEESSKEHEETSKEVDTLKQISGEEHSKADDESKDLNDKIEELKKQKQEHLEKKTTFKEEILAKLDEKVKDEHAINKELPTHLRKEINEKDLKDTGSLFSADESVVEVAKPTVKDSEPSNTAPLASKDASDVSHGVQKSPKKVHGFKRFSKFLRSPTKSSKTNEISSPKSARPISGAELGHRREVSGGSDEYSDDVSLGRQNNNAGGIFKEDI